MAQTIISLNYYKKDHYRYEDYNGFEYPIIVIYDDYIMVRADGSIENNENAILYITHDFDGGENGLVVDFQLGNCSPDAYTFCNTKLELLLIEIYELRNAKYNAELFNDYVMQLHALTTRFIKNMTFVYDQLVNMKSDCKSSNY